MPAADPTPRGLYPLRVVPGMTTAAELADALSDLPDGTVLMSAFTGDDSGRIEFVDFSVPFEVEAVS